MKKGLIKAICLIVITSFWSCDKEMDTNFSGKTSDFKSIPNLSIVDGRLKFDTKESFSKFYYECTKLEDNDMEAIANSLYVQGFKSLRPMVTEENESINGVWPIQCYYT